MDTNPLEVRQSNRQITIPINRFINLKGTSTVRAIITNFKILQELYDKNLYKSPVQDITFEPSSKTSTVSLPLPDRPIPVPREYTDIEIELIDAIDRDILDEEQQEYKEFSAKKSKEDYGFVKLSPEIINNSEQIDRASLTFPVIDPQRSAIRVRILHDIGKPRK